MMHKILLILILAISSSLSGQILPLSDYWNRELERVEHVNGNPGFTSFKPVLKSEINYRKLTGEVKDSAKYYSTLSRLFFRDHLLEYKKDDAHITVDPLFQFEFYKDQINPNYNASHSKLYLNSRGALLQGKLGKAFEFQSLFIESQSVLPYYQDTIATTLGVIPGMGRHKPFNKVGYDYGVSQSWLSYSPKSWWSVQVGYGKQMIGNGYRSLLLSDAAMSYPMVRLNVMKSKWQYHTTAAILQEQIRLPLGDTGESLFRRKTGLWNYLVFLPTPTLEIGIMEACIDQRWTPHGTEAPPLHSYIPVIGLRGWMAQKDSANLSLYGLNLKWNLSSKTTFYGQYLVTAHGGSSSGFQMGALFTDIGVKNFDVRIEYNSTQASLYNHPEQNWLGYSQQNQSLGLIHFGNSEEWITRIHYRFNRWLLDGHYNQLNQSMGHGSNPYALTSADVTGYRLLQQLQAEIGYLIHPHTRTCLYLGFLQRHDTRNYIVYFGNPKIEHWDAQLITLRFSCDISSRYFDF
ncbi:MAG: hypothetical protein RL609_1719 [Bacteroidota bacterium]|mgnify:CR=1 FL=1|jgi:hypothetical protein